MTKGDVYALAYGDGAFDVVHAHQVLQHLADPVAALREMGRVSRPAGIVAVRDADYAAMTWYPDRPELHRWMELYQQVARHNGGEPDAGRRLVSWARAAGFASVDRLGVRVVLRRPSRPGLVVRNVGGPSARLELRRTGRAPRPLRPR